MGMGEEWLADHYFEMDHPFGMPSDTWTTKDGRKIKLKDMTERHIKNCMRLVGEEDLWYERFQKELIRRLLEDNE